jgi:hypothetical protein
MYCQSSQVNADVSNEIFANIFYPKQENWRHKPAVSIAYKEPNKKPHKEPNQESNQESHKSTNSDSN